MKIQTKSDNIEQAIIEAISYLESKSDHIAYIADENDEDIEYSCYFQQDGEEVIQYFIENKKGEEPPESITWTVQSVDWNGLANGYVVSFH